MLRKIITTAAVAVILSIVPVVSASAQTGVGPAPVSPPPSGVVMCVTRATHVPASWRFIEVRHDGQRLYLVPMRYVRHDSSGHYVRRAGHMAPVFPRCLLRASFH